MKFFKFLVLSVLIGAPGIASAASVSIGLNLSNIGLPDTTDYATVTISDDPMTDLIYFKITTDDTFFDKTGGNFGIQKFYFNSSLDLNGLSPMIVNGESNWGLVHDFSVPQPPGGFQASEFGRFQVQYSKNAQGNRADPLEFSLKVEGDTVDTYAQLNGDLFYFAVHIAGFQDLSRIPPFSETATDSITSGWFSAGVKPVPVPAAFWLFGTALIGFIGISRRTLV